MCNHHHHKSSTLFLHFALKILGLAVILLIVWGAAILIVK